MIKMDSMSRMFGSASISDIFGKGRNPHFHKAKQVGYILYTHKDSFFSIMISTDLMVPFIKSTLHSVSNMVLLRKLTTKEQLSQKVYKVT